MQKFNEYMETIKQKMDESENYRNGAMVAVDTGVRLTITQVMPYEEKYGEEAMLEFLRGLSETFEALMNADDLLENNS